MGSAGERTGLHTGALGLVPALPPRAYALRWLLPQVFPFVKQGEAGVARTPWEKNAAISQHISDTDSYQPETSLSPSVDWGHCSQHSGELPPRMKNQEQGDHWGRRDSLLTCSTPALLRTLS